MRLTTYPAPSTENNAADSSHAARTATEMISRTSSRLVQYLGRDNPTVTHVVSCIRCFQVMARHEQSGMTTQYMYTIYVYVLPSLFRSWSVDRPTCTVWPQLSPNHNRVQPCNTRALKLQTQAQLSLCTSERIDGDDTRSQTRRSSFCEATELSRLGEQKLRRWVQNNLQVSILIV